MSQNRDDLDREIEEEIRFHLEMRTRANRDAGMSPQDARAEAERQFGDPEVVRKAGRKYLKGIGPSRDASPLGSRGSGPFRPWKAVRQWLTHVRQDLVVGTRSLARNPVLTGAAVLSLALGIGANTANFSIVYGLLYRPLPFENAEGLVFIDAWNPERGDGDAPVTWADLSALRSSGVFQDVGAFSTRSFTLTGSDQPERIAGANVTPGLFQLLGVESRQGRLFLPEDGAESGFQQTVLISDGLWKGRFGGDNDIVGRTIQVDRRALVVVGVMAPGFRFPEREDLWLPVTPADPTDHAERALVGVGRLAPGATLDAAREVADRWSSQAAREFPETHEGWSVRTQPLRHGWIDAPARTFTTFLLAAVGFVLLLACANVANLLLARASDRRQELAIRSALGAGGGRLAHQVLVESLVLGLAGGVLGILVARFWLDAFSRAIPEDLSWWIRITIDGPILLYTLVISMGTSLLFGLLPAFQASRANLAEAVRVAGRGVLGGRGRARTLLVVAEVGLAVVLLVSASVMVRSFMALQSADPGFDDSRILSFRVVPTGERYEDLSSRAEYFRELGERLWQIQGAEAATATSAIPADDGGGPIRVLPDGTPEDQALYASAIASTRALFRTLDVQLLAGREFSLQEQMDPEASVAIVGHRLAQRLWPQGDAVGRNLVVPGTGAFRVIGVAPDLQYEEFGEDLEGARLQVHLPYARSGNRGMAVLVRASGNPAGLVRQVRQELAAIDPTVAPYDLMTMEERRALTTWEQRLFGKSFAIFGAIALVLALCGIYGVIAYSVARQTREIGIRIALGARPKEVRFRVVGRALAMAGIGAFLGLLGILAFTRILQRITYGVSATDPRILLGVVATLLATALLAGWIPARRAARVDPTEALRAE